MKKALGIVAMVVLVMGTAVGAARAADVDVSAGVDFNSAYVWRGITFNDGFVAQPWLDVSKNGFGLNVWGNYDIDDYDGAVDESEFSEIDLTLSYALPVEVLDISVGYISYQFPNGGSSTQEGYLSLGKSLTDSFSVGLDFYLDLDDNDLTYTVLSAAYDMALSDALSLGASVSAAYAGDGYSADGDAGLYDYTLGLSLGYALSDAWSASFGVTYVDSLDDDKLDDAACDVNFYGGLSIAYAF